MTTNDVIAVASQTSRNPKWTRVTLGQIGNVVRGASPRPAGDPKYFNGDFIPWLTVAALTNIPDSELTVVETTGKLTEAGAQFSRKLTPGTIIIANSGATLGVAKILGVPCCANDGIAALLDLRFDVDARYVVHYINSQTEKLRTVVATGNGQPNLNTGLIGAIEIDLPCKREQSAIADALSAADALINSLEQLLTKKRQIKQGAMQELLTGKRRLLPRADAWREVPLGSLGRWTGGMTPSMARPDYWSPAEVPWLSSGDLKEARLSESTKYISKLAVGDGATTVVPAKSVVIVMRSGILRKHLPVGITLKEMAINQDLKAVQPKDDVAPEFLLHALTFSGERILATCLKSGTTVESIEFRWLKAFTIDLPTLPEQEVIAGVLSDMDAEISALVARLTKARALKQAMTQTLLTGRIRLGEPDA